jgi:hypothetical protein
MIHAVLTSTNTAPSSGVPLCASTPTTRMRSGYRIVRSYRLPWSDSRNPPGARPSSRATRAPTTASPSSANGVPAANASPRTSK